MADRYIRYSQFAKFMRCRRSWLFEYVRGLELDRPPGQTKGARDLGTLVHRLAEAYYKGEDWVEAWQQAQSDIVAAGDWSEEWAEHFNLARIMFEGYIEWVEREAIDANESVLLVEPQLEADFGIVRGDRIFVTGKPDLIVHNHLSDVNVIVDTKTVQQIETVQHHSGQGLTYALLAKKMLGLDIGLFRTNQLRKVKRTARANPPFYGHSEMLINPTHLETHERHLRGRLDTMVQLMRYYEERQETNREEYDLLFYPSPDATCSWSCDFLAPCKVMDNGSNYEYIIRTHYRHKPEIEAPSE